MKIYIDKEYRCYAKKGENLREVESSFFDGKSERFICGYRFIPTGEKWTREDGTIFYGEMLNPIENPMILNMYDEIDKKREKDKQTVGATNEQMLLLEDCIVEMANIVYGENKQEK